MIELKNTVVVSQEQISTDMTNETVILHMGNGIYYGLDEVGSFIWKHIQAPRRVEEVINALLEEYNVARDLANGDTIRLLTDLEMKGLVKVVA